MARNIVGIDIGGSSVKLARYNKTLKGYRFIQFLKREYKKGSNFADDPSALSFALEEVIDNSIRENDFIISCLSSKDCIIRNIEVPFTDNKKIREIIKYEIEPDTLFPIDSILVDFFVVSKDKKKGTSNLIVIGVEKKIVELHLSLLKEFNIEPDILDIDCLALWNDFSLMYKNLQKNDPENEILNTFNEVVAIIDIGAEKTSVNVIDAGRLIYTRTVHIGGNVITEKIMDNQKISFVEAENIKRDSDNVSDTGIVESINSSISEIIKEIEFTFFSYYSKAEEGKEITSIFLTGGTANSSIVTEKMVEKFSQKIMPYDFSDFDGSHLGEEYQNEKFYIPLPSGLGLRGIKKSGNTINFRLEEFVLKSSYEYIKGSLIWISVFSSIILLLGLFDFYYYFSVKEKRYNTLKIKAQAIFKEAFPKVPIIIDEYQQMKSKIKENEKKLLSFGGTAGVNLSSLELLREISFRISDDITVDIEDLVISQESIRLTGKTVSFDALDHLKKKIQESKYFEEFKIDGANASEKNKLVEFKASITLNKKI